MIAAEPPFRGVGRRCETISLGRLPAGAESIFSNFA
jgi:hypothetical protein